MRHYNILRNRRQFQKSRKERYARVAMMPMFIPIKSCALQVIVLLYPGHLMGKCRPTINHCYLQLCHHQPNILFPPVRNQYQMIHRPLMFARTHAIMRNVHLILQVESTLSHANMLDVLLHSINCAKAITSNILDSK